MVLEKACTVTPRETWYHAATSDPTVPPTAIQPRGLRLDVGLRQGSASMMRTPVRVRISSGNRATALVDIYLLASVAGMVKVGMRTFAAGSAAAAPSARAVPAESMARIQRGEATPIASIRATM